MKSFENIQINTRSLVNIDTLDNNGMVFDKTALDRMVEQDKIWGEFGDPNGGLQRLAVIIPEEVSHTVKSFERDGDQITATIDVLDTPMGKTLQQHIDQYGIESIEFKPRVLFISPETGNIIMHFKFIAIDAIYKV